MSTVKTDVITAVSTNGDLSLDGLGSGGVSIASTLKMTKGGDIASASPLVIDTDGNYFDVTGTTNFAAMTVEAGNFFMLQFDGALTITHGSGIELPGAANLTTAAGDRLICYATAANTVEVMSVETEAAAAGGAWSVLTSGTLSGASSLNITSIVKTIKIFMHITTSAAVLIKARTSTDGGSSYDSGGSDYAYTVVSMVSDGSTVYGSNSGGADHVNLTIWSVGSTSAESCSLELTLNDPADAATYTNFHSTVSSMEIGNTGRGSLQARTTGTRVSAANVDAFQIYPASGTFSGDYVVVALN